MTAAPVDAWRDFDEGDPDPGYFEFDWLSARHPDLYHRFAVSTTAGMRELCRILDLSGLVVVDIGAGTGRSAIAAAEAAREVIAVDAYESVVDFGRTAVEDARVDNVTYLLGHRSSLPLADSSVDAALSVHAVLDPVEAHRVLKPHGLLVQLTVAPGSGCGELTEVLAPIYPNLITSVAAAGQFSTACPPEDGRLDVADWEGAPVSGGIFTHDFTIVADFGSAAESAAIFGRIYGSVAARYLRERGRSTVAWRYRIRYAHIDKT